MLGAIIGDIVGSRFEWNNHRSKEFKLFDDEQCFCTDDSIMSLAVCRALIESKADFSDLGLLATENMRALGMEYPNAGYGGMFAFWLRTDRPEPYNSFGNGAAMRVSGCGYAGKTVDEVKRLSKAVTEVTHNHPEGLKGAEATAVAVFLARTGRSAADIRDRIEKDYYKIDFTLDDIRDTYSFNETCQQTVPQALEAFFEANGFEDAIRNAISIGGDSDTVGAITGAVAGAYFGVPQAVRDRALRFLDGRLLKILTDFEKRFSD